MPKSKRFIDKKKAVTFQLVHRSQQDPLVADENAPQRVLLPQQAKEERLEEQHKYGVYFDDDFNYLEHLKDPKDHKVEWPDHVEEELATKAKEKAAKLQLPSSVFASEVEEEVGMLGKAAPVSGPQLHLDPDLVAAMDDDFDYEDPENELEDNFIELAEGVASDQEFDEEEEDQGRYFGSDFEDDEERDEVASLRGSEMSFQDEETKSRFTNYSMSSSVIRRNNQLSLLDDRFEKLYEGYDENEIGALDCEEIEGFVPETSDLLLQYAEEFKKEQAREHLDKDAVLSKIKEQLGREINDEDSDGDELVAMELPEKEKWDCESILSTYSNIYNHPKLISEPPKDKIRISKKTGIPLNILDAGKLTTKALNRFNAENEAALDSNDKQSRGPKSAGGQSIISQLSTLSIRPKDETAEERKERKKLLKEYKKERRLEKKLNKEAFKEEFKRQAKIAVNNRNNVQGNKIL